MWRIGIGHLVVLLFYRCINSCNKCKLCSRWHWQRCTWSDQWSSWISWLPVFSLRYDRKEKFCMRASHLKVPSWSLVWNELLTKKLPIFLSRLNEIREGCEKIVPVSESFWSNLTFLRMTNLTTQMWGWNVRVNGMRSVFSFYAVCSVDCRSICWAQWWPAWTTETSHVYRKTGILLLIFSEKSESSLHKRISLRNCEKGMKYLTCDGWKDKCNK